jgi:hypothetical protein
MITVGEIYRLAKIHQSGFSDTVLQDHRMIIKTSRKNGFSQMNEGPATPRGDQLNRRVRRLRRKRVYERADDRLH